MCKASTAAKRAPAASPSLSSEAERFSQGARSVGAAAQACSTGEVRVEDRGEEGRQNATVTR